MKKPVTIFGWLVTAYGKNNKVIYAFIVEERTEQEAEDEALTIPAVISSSDWTMVKIDDEVKRFVEEYGLSQSAVKQLEGFKGGSSAVSEMAVNFGYVWATKFKKWINKNNSNYDERDEVVLDYIRTKYC